MNNLLSVIGNIPIKYWGMLIKIYINGSASTTENACVYKGWDLPFEIGMFFSKAGFYVEYPNRYDIVIFRDKKTYENTIRVEKVSEREEFKKGYKNFSTTQTQVDTQESQQPRLNIIREHSDIEHTE